MAWNVLLAILFAFGTTASPPPCADVTHSECGDDDAHLFLETDVPNKEGCHLLCLGVGEVCTFLIFDKTPIARGNCRLYNENFSNYINHCNELAGPKTSEEGCDLFNPPDNTCQIHRGGKCNFANVQETLRLNSWKNCQGACQSISKCQFWQFKREEELCFILYSSDRTCAWEFSPREPTLEDCDDDLSCNIPEPQKYGDWFCPSSTEGIITTCHLECHPGYVSSDGTVITCQHGVWSKVPGTCVSAVAIITGGTSKYSPEPLFTTVEVYAEGLHKRLPNIPEARAEHSVELVNSVLLLCGGVNTERSCLSFTSSHQWISHSTTTSPRYFHSSVSMLGQLHLLGGGDLFDAVSTTEHLIPPATQWTSGWDLYGIFGHGTKITPELLIVTEEDDMGSDRNWKAAVSYNVTSGAATRLQDRIYERVFLECVYVKDSDTGFRGVLAAGGFEMSGDGSRESEIYNINTGEWSTTGQLTTERFGMKLVVLGVDILALGGFDNDENALSSVDRFNITTNKWSAVDEMLEGKGNLAVTGVPPSYVGVNIRQNF